MKSIILALLLGSGLLACGQVNSIWGQVGGSYIATTYDDGSPEADVISVRTAVALDVARAWTFGVKINHIYYLDTRPDWQYFWLAGPFVRFALAPSDRNRLYLESGVFLSNYRVDYDRPVGTAYRDLGLIYTSVGGGLEHRIWRGLFVDAGFYTHPLLNRPRPRYAYNTYFVGLILRLREDR